MILLLFFFLIETSSDYVSLLRMYPGWPQTQGSIDSEVLRLNGYTTIPGSIPPPPFFFFFLVVFFVCFVFVCFFETGFLCSPDCPGTHSVDQAGLKLRDLFASKILALKNVPHHA